MKLAGVLETCLYAADLAATERFYSEVLGLEPFSRVEGRHVFFRCGQAVFLIFNPERTATDQSWVGKDPVPLHGAQGAGHLCFAVREDELPAWSERLARHGIPIEAQVTWPRGGRSLYFRDPAGNSIELASPRIWGLPEPQPDGP